MSKCDKGVRILRPSLHPCSDLVQRLLACQPLLNHLPDKIRLRTAAGDDLAQKAESLRVSIDFIGGGSDNLHKSCLMQQPAQAPGYAGMPSCPGPDLLMQKCVAIQ